MVYELEDVLQESSLETVLENGKQAVILVPGGNARRRWQNSEFFWKMR